MTRKRGAGAPKSSTALVALVCLAIGAAGGWGLAQVAHDRPAGLPKISRPREAESELARMGPGELRDEARRLRSTCDDKDRQIAELTIQLAIATKGSKSNRDE